MAEALAAAVERLRARVEEQAAAAGAAPALAKRPPHKHSMSLIKRVRIGFATAPRTSQTATRRLI